MMRQVRRESDDQQQNNETNYLSLENEKLARAAIDLEETMSRLIR
jgi:hypothetical protein